MIHEAKVLFDFNQTMPNLIYDKLRIGATTPAISFTVLND